MIGRRVRFTKAGIVPFLDQDIVHVPLETALAPDQTHVVDMIFLPLKGTAGRVFKGVGIVFITAVESRHIQAQFHALPFVEVARRIPVNVHDAFVGIMPLLDAIPAGILIAVVHDEERIMDALIIRNGFIEFVITDVGENFAGSVDALDIEFHFTGWTGWNLVVDIVKGCRRAPTRRSEHAAALPAERLARQGVIDFENAVLGEGNPCEERDEQAEYQSFAYADAA